jgi:hypothetical protein
MVTAPRFLEICVLIDEHSVSEFSNRIIARDVVTDLGIWQA